MERRAVARHKKTAADLGAWLCFDDEVDRASQQGNLQNIDRRCRYGGQDAVSLTLYGAPISK